MILPDAKAWLPKALLALFALAVLLFALSPSLPSFRAVSPEFASAAEAARAGNPKGLELTLSSPRSFYFAGERIPMDLLYRNSGGGDYSIGVRSYDRSGRFCDLEFLVDGPKGSFVDPVLPLVSTGMGGGLGSDESVTENVRHFTLNDYVRFDKPGTYYVYCRSWQVSDKSGVIPVLASNSLRLKIAMPGPMHSFFRTWLAAFEAQAPFMHVRQEAIKKLGRYGDRLACDSLISLYSASPSLKYRNMDFDIAFSLVACRDWPYAAARLKRILADPSQPVVKSLLGVFDALSAPREAYDELLAGDMIESHFSRSNFWRERMKRENANLSVLAESLKSRRGANRVDAVALLVDRLRDASRYECLAGVYSLPVFIANESFKLQLAECLPDLPFYDQEFLLAEKWDFVKCPEILPALERISQKTLEPEKSSWLANWLEDIVGELRRSDDISEGQLRKLKILASFRLLQLRGDDSAARAAAVDFIKRGEADNGILPVLRSIKDPCLPELDGLLLEQLRTVPYSSGACLNRFASPAAVPEALAYFNDCKPDESSSSNLAGVVMFLMSNASPAFMEYVKSQPKVERLKYEFLSSALRDCYGEREELFAIEILPKADVSVSLGLIYIMAQRGSQRCVDPILAKLDALKWDAANRKESIAYEAATICASILERAEWRLDETQAARFCALMPEGSCADSFKRRLAALPKRG